MRLRVLRVKFLHFSDTHNNQRAIAALARVAAAWADAHVCVTGDVCNCWWQDASTVFDQLTNPGVWLVRGNHDKEPYLQFGHLVHARWQAPYLASDIPGCVLVGFDSESRDGVEAQLSDLGTGPHADGKKTLIALHHRPYSESLKRTIGVWAANNFPSLSTVVLLHGHDHHRYGFFAEHEREELGGLRFVTSYVYSAQMGVRDGNLGIPGCANLITVESNGSVSVRTVYDPQEMYVVDGFVERRWSGGSVRPDSRWRRGRAGDGGKSPVYELEAGEDPLAVIDEYWRWVASN
jgi:hypothetical protein